MADVDANYGFIVRTGFIQKLKKNKSIKGVQRDAMIACSTLVAKKLKKSTRQTTEIIELTRALGKTELAVPETKNLDTFFNAKNKEFYLSRDHFKQIFDKKRIGLKHIYFIIFALTDAPFSQWEEIAKRFKDSFASTANSQKSEIKITETKSKSGGIKELLKALVATRLKSPILVAPQPAYEQLKETFKGYWVGICRKTSEVDQNLSLVRYTFEARDWWDNFIVERSDSHAKNEAITDGVMDEIDWNITFILRSKNNQRNVIIMFDYPINNISATTPTVILATGLAKKKTFGQSAWRELIVRFPENYTSIPKPFSELKKNFISYEEFIGIDEKIISRNDKLYLADQNHSILTFPLDNNSTWKDYNRKIEAFGYSDREYFVYLPYRYAALDPDFYLFRLKMVVDRLTQTHIEVNDPFSEPLDYHGFTSLIEKTVRITVAHKKKQKMHLLLNGVQGHLVGRIALDGHILCTNSIDKATSEECIVVETSLMRKCRSCLQCKACNALWKCEDCKNSKSYKDCIKCKTEEREEKRCANHVDCPDCAVLTTISHPSVLDKGVNNDQVELKRLRQIIEDYNLNDILGSLEKDSEQPIL